MIFNECVVEYGDPKSHLLGATAVHCDVKMTTMSNDVDYLEFVTFPKLELQTWSLSTIWETK